MSTKGDNTACLRNDEPTRKADLVETKKEQRRLIYEFEIEKAYGLD